MRENIMHKTIIFLFFVTTLLLAGSAYAMDYVYVTTAVFDVPAGFIIEWQYTNNSNVAEEATITVYDNDTQLYPGIPFQVTIPPKSVYRYGVSMNHNTANGVWARVRVSSPSVLPVLKIMASGSVLATFNTGDFAVFRISGRTETRIW